MKKAINKIHYSNSGNAYFKLLLWFLSFFYAFAINFKNLLYKLHLLNEKKVNAFVICVGNLTTGGVGKSPVTCEIANYLSALGKRVAIISRGYKGQLDNSKINLVKDFEKIVIDNPYLTGDEPYMLAKNTQKCAVITCKNRVLAANFAIKHLDVEYIILDDGFSNRTIKKDLTLLLVDKEKQFGNKGLLPYGPLREPLSEIERCDKIIFIDKHSPKVKLPVFLKPSFECKFTIDKFYNIKTGQIIESDKEKDVIAFCAIGQPQQFFDYIYDSFNLIKTFDFEDHYTYTKDDILNISKKCKTLVTTQKDEVKLKNIVKNLDVEIIILKLKAELDIEGILKNDNKA